MPLEDINNPDKINIKSLVLKEPIKRLDLPFNPETELDTADWENISFYFFDNRLDAGEEFLHFKSHLKLLSEEEFTELNKSDLYWSITKQHLDSLSEELKSPEDAAEELDGLIFYGANAGIIYPSKSQEILQYLDNSKKDVNDLIDAEIKNLTIMHNVSWNILTSLALCYPQEVLPKIHSNSNLINSLKNTVVTDYPHATSADWEWLNYAGYAAQFRLLCPSQWPFVNITEKNWELMKGSLESFKTQNQVPDLVDMAFYLKVLSAEKAAITNSGEIEIIMSEPNQSFRENELPLPTVRKF